MRPRPRQGSATVPPGNRALPAVFHRPAWRALGWVPEDFSTDLLQTQSWLEQHRGKSVTALEILHGVLSNLDMEKHAFFYFRDPAYAAAQPGFTEEKQPLREKLTKLKDDIRKSGSPVSEPFATPKQLGE